MKYVEIRHRDDPYGLALTLFPEVAEQLGLRQNQQVDEATFRQALRLNCEMGIAICEMNMAIDEQNKAADLDAARQGGKNDSRRTDRNLL